MLDVQPTVTAVQYDVRFATYMACKLLQHIQCSRCPLPLGDMEHSCFYTCGEVGRRLEGVQCRIELEQGINLNITTVTERKDRGT